jgi:8-oxo-dGTP pyrophosphatase MutT (NUDIX family)
VRRDLDAARRCIRLAVVDDDAERHRATILHFLDEHPDALHRACLDGHLTGSAMVVDPAARRFLVLLHTKLRLWLQPGGHADGDGELGRVALREASEETGIADLQLVEPAIDVDVHRVEPPGEQPHLHLDLRYLVLAPEGAHAPGNKESLDRRWVDLDELVALGVDAGTVRLARAALAKLDAMQ